MTVIILTLVIIGYIFIATEAFNHINKAAVAIFVGVAAWLLYMLSGELYIKAEHAEDYTTFILEGGRTFNSFVAHNVFPKYIAEACEVILFLLATLGITDVLNGNECFNFLGRTLRTRKATKLLWLLCVTTFIIFSKLGQPFHNCYDACGYAQTRKWYKTSHDIRFGYRYCCKLWRYPHSYRRC